MLNVLFVILSGVAGCLCVLLADWLWEDRGPLAELVSWTWYPAFIAASVFLGRIWHPDTYATAADWRWFVGLTSFFFTSYVVFGLGLSVRSAPVEFSSGETN